MSPGYLCGVPIQVEPPLVAFEDNDRDYLFWTSQNARGYVANCYRNPSADYQSSIGLIATRLMAVSCRGRRVTMRRFARQPSRRWRIGPVAWAARSRSVRSVGAEFAELEP